MKQTKRRPAHPGIYWFIPECGEPIIVEVVRDGGGWHLWKIGTDQMFYLTRPIDMPMKLWKVEKRFHGHWCGPLEPPAP